MHSDAKPESDLRYTKETKSYLEISKRSENTFVVVVAIHNNPDINAMRRLSAKKGIPIGGYVYDRGHEAYLLRCVDYMNLGFIPLSFKLGMKGVGDWGVNIPIPESILRRHLTVEQKRDLKRFTGQFGAENNPDFRIEFVQMTGFY
jgi:hypothetical protein